MRTFTKKALSIDDQIQLLKNRQLNIKDSQRAARYLEVISFFRLSPYMRSFQIKDDKNHNFKSDAEFKQIVDLYAFDRELRLFIIDAVKRFEVSVRATINNHMGPKYGAHWYLDEQLFRKEYSHKRLLSDIESRMAGEQKSLKRDISGINKDRRIDAKTKRHRIESRTNENYLRFYSSEYDTPRMIPGWAMVEELSLGALSRLFQNIAKDSDKKAIAKRFKAPHDLLTSWLHTVTFIRNCCAHHSRLWNRELSVPPKRLISPLWDNIPKRLEPSQVRPDRRVFIVLMMLSYLMKQISPDSKWCERLHKLIEKYPSVNLSMMGFPENWQEFLPA